MKNRTIAAITVASLAAAIGGLALEDVVKRNFRPQVQEQGNVSNEHASFALNWHTPAGKRFYMASGETRYVDDFLAQAIGVPITITYGKLNEEGHLELDINGKPIQPRIGETIKVLMGEHPVTNDLYLRPLGIDNSTGKLHLQLSNEAGQYGWPKSF